MYEFKNLLWCPIDLPKFEHKTELITDFVKEFVPKSARAFEAQKLTTMSPNYGKSTWLDELTSSQEKFKEYIDNFLPFDNLVNIKIHHPHRQGSMHIDFIDYDKNVDLYKHNRDMEPCGYRMVIAGSKKGDLVIDTGKRKRIPELPEDTDWYVTGHTNVLHGNTRYCPERYIVFCHIWVNKDSHQKLLTRSLEKYKDYAIWAD
jgi:hypothetical protein